MEGVCQQAHGTPTQKPHSALPKRNSRQLSPGQTPGRLQWQDIKVPLEKHCHPIKSV